MYRAKLCTVLMAALFVLPDFSSVEAQWVMAARAVKNRVQQMSQKSETGGYDVAIVVLEAAPAAVPPFVFGSLYRWRLGQFWQPLERFGIPCMRRPQ